MKIRLSDAALLGDLLAFLCAEGCIAYAESRTITVIRPDSFGATERNEVEALLERWRASHPRAEPQLTDA
jgi:hypothetical protein